MMCGRDRLVASASRRCVMSHSCVLHSDNANVNLYVTMCMHVRKLTGVWVCVSYILRYEQIELGDTIQYMISLSDCMTIFGQGVSRTVT